MRRRGDVFTIDCLYVSVRSNDYRRTIMRKTAAERIYGLEKRIDLLEKRAALYIRDIEDELKVFRGGVANIPLWMKGEDIASDVRDTLVALKDVYSAKVRVDDKKFKLSAKVQYKGHTITLEGKICQPKKGGDVHVDFGVKGMVLTHTLASGSLTLSRTQKLFNMHFEAQIAVERAMSQFKTIKRRLEAQGVGVSGEMVLEHPFRPRLSVFLDGHRVEISLVDMKTGALTCDQIVREILATERF
jgi:hypothetical protein